MGKLQVTIMLPKRLCMLSALSYSFYYFLDRVAHHYVRFGGLTVVFLFIDTGAAVSHCVWCWDRLT